MPPTGTVPEGIGLSTPYQRYHGEKRLDPEREVVSLIQDGYHPWT